MVIEMSWGAKKYRVTSFEVSLQSAGATQLADCIPNTIRVDLELPPTASPAKDFFNFARTQHANAKTKGTGQISVFKGHDGKKEGQAIQTVKFDKAWISDMDTSVSEHDDEFSFTLTFVTTEVSVSGENFKHDGREELFRE